MEHIPYPKTPEQLTSSVLSQQWVATEKIHGANFVIGIDKNRIRYGKRKAWLEDKDLFFGWQVLRGTLEASARQVFSRCRNADCLYIYGELFGGGYPHDDVQASSVFTPIQTGVWYAPDLQYTVFDILIIKDKSREFLSFSEITSLLQETPLKSVPVLGYGAYQSLMSIPVRYASQLHRQFSLPEIPNNFAEGIILKPDCRMSPDHRPVVKRKIEEFSENRFNKSQPFDPKPSTTIEDLISILPMMINQARVDSARSKVGENTQAIIEECLLDILIDIESIFSTKDFFLSEAEEQYLSEQIKMKINHYL